MMVHMQYIATSPMVHVFGAVNSLSEWPTLCLLISTELRAFLMYVTGKIMIAKKSIQVLFMDDSQAITAHTCSGLLVFPRGVFRSYEDFSVALKAVVSTRSSVSFNIV